MLLTTTVSYSGSAVFTRVKPVYELLDSIRCTSVPTIFAIFDYFCAFDFMVDKNHEEMNIFHTVRAYSTPDSVRGTNTDRRVP